MKKFLLPALVMVFLVSVFLVGVFLYKNSGNRRFAAEKGEEIKVKSEKLKVKNEGEKVSDNLPEWVGEYILTPGPVKRTIKDGRRLSSVNGRFQELEPVPNSSDRYLILSGVPDNFRRLRLIYIPKPEEGVLETTQINIITPKKETSSIFESVRQAGTVDKLSEDEVNLLLRPNVPVKAMFYQGNEGPVRDKDGTYYVIAVTTLEK